MVISKKEYDFAEVKAAKSILIELMHILREYRNSLILIGGWVPEILFPNASTPHVGSLDVDILLNHNKIGNPGYSTIAKLLEERDYLRSPKQPFTYYKSVKLKGGNLVKVQVDFLAGAYHGTGKSRRTQRVQDICPRKIKGGDMVFSFTENVSLKGILPNGAVDTVEFQVISLPAFIILKSIALKNRLKEKDAWDIYFCILQYEDRLDNLASQFTALMGNKIAQEAINNLKEAFSGIDSIGPTMIADFEESESEERELIMRDAFERVNIFLSFIE